MSKKKSIRNRDNNGFHANIGKEFEVHINSQQRTYHATLEAVEGAKLFFISDEGQFVVADILLDRIQIL